MYRKYFAILVRHHVDKQCIKVTM